MQIIIQGELERLTEYLKGNYVLRAQDFQTKLEMSTKLKRKIAFDNSVFGYENKE